MPLSIEGGPARRRGGGGARARRARRRGHPDRHRRRLRVGRGGGRATTSSSSPPRCARTAATRRRCSWRPRAATRVAARTGNWTVDPAYLSRACEASLRRLGVDAIGLYQFHRPDPDRRPRGVDGRDRGRCTTTGLIARWPASRTPTSPRSTRPARSLGGALVRVQNQFSPGWRSSAGELEHCAEVGMAWLPWSPFGGVSRRGCAGLGARRVRGGGRRARRSRSYRVTLAWQLAQADVVIPIPGASRRESILDSAAAADLQPSPPSTWPA